MAGRAQISLDVEIYRRARAKAAERGISFAEYVRGVIRCDLAKRSSGADISRVFDLGASVEPTNIARDKDKILNEAVWQDYVRKTGRKPRRRV
jgi:hypothetical protein